MMKAILEFNLDDQEDKVALDRALTADKAYSALSNIAQEIFRPARKHGYNDKELNRLLNLDPENNVELISLLEAKFYKILEDYTINLENV